MTHEHIADRVAKAEERAEKAEADVIRWREQAQVEEARTSLARKHRREAEAQVADLLRQRDAASDEVAALTAKLDEARGVLRPFAEAAATIPSDQEHPDYDRELVDETFGLTWGDLRCAAAVIAPKTEKETT